MESGTARPWLLGIDTGTSRIVVVVGSPDGRVLRALDRPAGHHHGERLLPGVEQLLGETGLALAGLGGIVVGTGPGAFTGLRVGLATAKALAHALGVRIAGVGTGVALLRAAATTSAVEVENLVLVLPAGPHDRVEVRAGETPRLLSGGTAPALEPADVLVAVDLAGRAPDDACVRGDAAQPGLAAALLELGAARLATGPGDDPAQLVPEYVTLPRGVHAAGGEIEWSRGPR